MWWAWVSWAAARGGYKETGGVAVQSRGQGSRAGGVLRCVSAFLVNFVAVPLLWRWESRKACVGEGPSASSSRDQAAIIGQYGCCGNFLGGAEARLLSPPKHKNVKGRGAC